METTKVGKRSDEVHPVPQVSNGNPPRSYPDPNGKGKNENPSIDRVTLTGDGKDSSEIRDHQEGNYHPKKWYQGFLDFFKSLYE